jgi:lysophospholipase L1-like esterase
MPWYVYYIAGGGTFLPGAGLIALAIIGRAISARRWIKSILVVSASLGIALVMICAEALAWWIYIIWTAAILAWLLRDKIARGRRRSIIDLATLAITLLAAGVAISYQRRPALGPATFGRMYVIGDSISAGVGRNGEVTWPSILGSEHRVQVINLSHGGATIADATHYLQSQPLGEGLILLEIGGNDILTCFGGGHASAEQFGRDLDVLAQRVSAPGRRVVMLELPLFPFNNSYGLQQRRVAAKYGIAVIPRKYFISVLAGPGATVDGIHLSAAGHQRMARMVWDMVGASLRSNP